MSNDYIILQLSSKEIYVPLTSYNNFDVIILKRKVLIFSVCET